MQETRTATKPQQLISSLFWFSQDGRGNCVLVLLHFHFSFSPFYYYLLVWRDPFNHFEGTHCYISKSSLNKKSSKLLYLFSLNLQSWSRSPFSCTPQQAIIFGQPFFCFNTIIDSFERWRIQTKEDTKNPFNEMHTLDEANTSQHMGRMVPQKKVTTRSWKQWLCFR